MNGIAIWLTWVPNSEIVAAVQRLREVRLAEEGTASRGGGFAHG